MINCLAFSSSLLTKFRRQDADHHDHELNCTALCCAKSGQCAVVAHLVGDADEAARLRDLGVREGAVVTVLQDGNPLVVKIDEARLGIGRSAALNVMCRIVE